MQSPAKDGPEFIEDFMSSVYNKERQSKISRAVFTDGKEHVLDGLRLQFLSDILPFGLNLVEVRESKVHGRGVFAISDIQEGEIATFYPGDVVQYAPDSHRDHSVYAMAVYPSKRALARRGSKEVLFRDGAYALLIDDKYTIIGDPAFDGDSDYVGHFINDRAKHSSTKQSVMTYIAVSMATSNCRFRILKGLHVAMVASRNIKAGKELYVSYGVKYWEDYNRKGKLQPPSTPTE